MQLARLEELEAAVASLKEANAHLGKAASTASELAAKNYARFETEHAEHLEAEADVVKVAKERDDARDSRLLFTVLGVAGGAIAVILIYSVVAATIPDRLIGAQ